MQSKISNIEIMTSLRVNSTAYGLLYNHISFEFWQNDLHSKFNVCIKICLTHWSRVMHIYVSKLTIICSDNGLSPGRRQAIICTNAGILLIWTLSTNLSEI